MPDVLASPRSLRNGEVITEFTDTTSTTAVTYTYPLQQAGISIENSGVADIFVTVGSFTNQVVKSNKTWKADVVYTSFSIRSNANSQEFTATAFQNDVEGSGEADSVARGLISNISSQLANKANQTELEIVNASVNLKANKTDLNSTNENVNATNLRVDALVINSGNANVEVTDSHVSAVKNKTFTTLKNRLEEDESELKTAYSAQYPAKNLLLNGNFLDTSIWTVANAGALTVLNGVGSFTPNAVSGRLRQSISAVLNHKYYFAAHVKASKSVSLYAETGITFAQTNIAPTGDFVRASNIGTASATTAGTTQFQVRDFASSNFVEIQVKNAVVLDVTEIFGAGKEPTKEQMDNVLLSKFIDGWLDINITPLYDLKQVQESLSDNKNDTKAKVSYSELLFFNTGTKPIAHKGYSNVAPESTIPAIQKAGEAGFWGVDIDVSTTSDGQFVVLHDNTVDRTTNGTGFITQMTLAEAKALTVDFGANIGLYPDLKIPTLAEALLACRKYNLVPVIEPKSIQGAYQGMVDVIKSCGMEGKTIISTGIANINTIRTLSKKVPVQVLSLGTDEASIRTDIAAISGIANNAGVTASFQYLTDSIVSYARGLGVVVSCYTVNDQSAVDTLTGLGVDAISSDSLIWQWK